MKNVNDMTKGTPLPLLFQFALPLMLGDLFQQLYTLADSIVVGRLIGINAFAAVSAAGFFYWLIFVIVLGFSHGAGTLYAQLLGAKKMEDAKRAFSMSVLISIIAGAFLSVLCVFITKPILLLLNTPTEIIRDTAAYLYGMFGGLTLTFLYNVTASAVRARGDSKTPLHALIMASVINIVLDILLVLTTPLGVAAVAIATVIGQGFACSYLLWHIVRDVELRPSWDHFRIDISVIKTILRISLPISAQHSVAALGGVVIQYVINGFGTVFIAGVTAARKIYSLLFLIGGAIEGSLATYTAQNYGAGRFDRIHDGMRIARRAALAGSVGISVVIAFSGRWIISLFIGADANNRMLDIAMNQLHICLLFLPALYLLFLYRSGLQGMGYTLPSLASGFIEMAFRILTALILPHFIGAAGIYAAEVIGWPVCALQLFICYSLIYRRESENYSC